MTTIQIENLKCGGCANTIIKGLQSISGIDNVEVNVDASEVQFDNNDESQLVIVKEKLSKMGYPEVGEDNTVFKQAKSFVSCAIGRISK